MSSRVSNRVSKSVSQRQPVRQLGRQLARPGAVPGANSGTRRLVVGALFGLALGTAMGCGSPGLPAAGAPEPVPPAMKPGTPPTPRTEPPAISGGTLLVLRDGKTAVAADPDRDVIWLADVEKLAQTGRIDLQSGDEPGRLVQDSAGKVHVALRRGGALLTIDPVTSKILDRRPACAAPRGLAYDAATDRLHLACAGGELVTFAASGGSALRALQLDGDLRDVVVQGSNLLISRFRSAELLTVSDAGVVTSRVKPRSVRSQQGPGGTDPNLALADAAVAWRIHALPDGQVAMLFERGTVGAVDTRRPGGYGNGQCKGVGIVGAALTLLGASGDSQPGPSLPTVAYAVDFAVSADGSELSLVVPGAQPATQSGVLTIARAAMTPSDPCGLFPNIAWLPDSLVGANNHAVAVAYDGAKHVIVQTRNPMYLVTGGRVISFQGAADVSSTGHAVFHQPTAAAMACVSCHPEGGNDGRVWNFLPIGERRTQDLRGGILATAPFHWDGDLSDMRSLMTTVFVGRMGGPQLVESQVGLLANWLDAQPTVPKAPSSDVQAVARGKQLFESAAVGCASCHSGAHFTNNTTVSVGTGKAFQVPSLIDLASRAPYMHTGCAATLAARFSPECGGNSHGNTSQLTTGQLADLVSYLQTL